MGLLLCLGVAMAQQPQGMEDLRVPARANIISYDDENAIEHLRYDDSPYYLSVMEDWEENTNVAHLSRLFPFSGIAGLWFLCR